MPKVSVLMPAYNAEKYIIEAIDSILHQSFPDFEFIIVDDNSSDNTWAIIQEYVVRDSRITAFRNDQNLGIAANRNKLLSLATGKYIVWQDADDVSMHYRIEKQYDFMEEHPTVGICGGGLQFFDETGDTSKRLYAETDEAVRKTIFRYSPVSQGASIYRAEAIKKAGGYDSGLPTAEDLDLSFRIGRCYSFANLPDVVLKYRQHQSDTFKNLRKMELITLNIRWKNHKNGAYTMTILDTIYNLLQFLSVYIIPTKLKIKLFNLIRNAK